MALDIFWFYHKHHFPNPVTTVTRIIIGEMTIFKANVFIYGLKANVLVYKPEKGRNIFLQKLRSFGRIITISNLRSS